MCDSMNRQLQGDLSMPKHTLAPDNEAWRLVYHGEAEQLRTYIERTDRASVNEGAKCCNRVADDAFYPPSEDPCKQCVQVCGIVMSCIIPARFSALLLLGLAYDRCNDSLYILKEGVEKDMTLLDYAFKLKKLDVVKVLSEFYTAEDFSRRMLAQLEMATATQDENYIRQLKELQPDIDHTKKTPDVAEASALSGEMKEMAMAHLDTINALTSEVESLRRQIAHQNTQPAMIDQQPMAADSSRTISRPSQAGLHVRRSRTRASEVTTDAALSL